MAMSADVINTSVPNALPRLDLLETSSNAKGGVSVDRSNETGARTNSKPDNVRLGEAVMRLNELISGVGRSLEFRIDTNAKQVVVTVLDKQNHEVIRQIPTEQALKLAVHIEGMVGLIFDEKV